MYVLIRLCDLVLVSKSQPTGGGPGVEDEQ